MNMNMIFLEIKLREIKLLVQLIRQWMKKRKHVLKDVKFFDLD